MIIGTATALGMAISNDRARTARGSSSGIGFSPTLAVSGSSAKAGFAVAAALDAVKPRDFLARQVAFAAGLTLLVFAAVATLPAISAFASSLSSPSRGAPGWQPPPRSEVVTTDFSRLWANSHTIAIEPGAQLEKALNELAHDRYNWSVLKAMLVIEDARSTQEQQVAAATRRAVAPAAPSYSLGSSSGYAPGTVLRARVTIYGCTGPGGGFCNNMASGGTAFQGAAACSSDLPFGTRLTIAGDPTGRIYECLDRGQLPPTWIDVYFSDTSDGMAWQSSIGGTVANIQIVN